MCRMRVIQSMNALKPNEKACEKMKTEEGKIDCEGFMKTMKEREKSYYKECHHHQPQIQRTNKISIRRFYFVI